MKKISLTQLKRRIKAEIKELGIIEGEQLFIENNSDMLFQEIANAWKAIRKHFKKTGLRFQEFSTDGQQFCWAISTKELTKAQQERFVNLYGALCILEDEEFDEEEFEESWGDWQEYGFVSKDERPGKGFPDFMIAP